LKLWQKEMLLISLPLIFSLVLAYLLFQADRESDRELHVRSITSTISRIETLNMEAVAAITAFTRTKTPDALRKFQQIDVELTAEFKNAKDLISNDPNELHALEHIQLLENRLFRIADDTALSSKEEGTILQLIGMREQLEGLISETHKEIDQLVADVKSQSNISSSEETQSSRTQKRFVLYALLIVNTLLTIGVAAFNARSTAARLQVMIDNTLRVASGKQLNPRLQGKDELAELDRVFHSMAAALEESDQKRIAVEKMKREFMAMVSHDLKTPLSSLLGTLGLLSAEAFGPLDEKGKSMVDKSQKQAKRLMNLANDLMLLEKLESDSFSIQLGIVSIADVISESVEAVRAAASERHIAIETPQSSEQLTADRERLIQVIANLLSNAIKFSPVGSTISISIIPNEDWLEIRVSDEGRGVPPSKQELIFEKFIQVETSDQSEKGGTGLGLPICKMIVESHRGSIGVKSVEGAGSSFWFRIPRSIDSPSC